MLFNFNLILGKQSMINLSTRSHWRPIFMSKIETEWPHQVPVQCLQPSCLQNATGTNTPPRPHTSLKSRNGTGVPAVPTCGSRFQLCLCPRCTLAKPEQHPAAIPQPLHQHPSEEQFWDRPKTGLCAGLGSFRLPGCSASLAMKGMLNNTWQLTGKAVPAPSLGPRLQELSGDTAAEVPWG